MSAFTLYRFYDVGDRLLYVGQTINPAQRFHQHRMREWWPEVTRIELEQLPDAEALNYAERDAIVCEEPIYNIVHNPRPVQPSNGEKREILEGFGWTCISNHGAGTFTPSWNPHTFYTRAAAWTQLQR